MRPATGTGGIAGERCAAGAGLCAGVNPRGRRRAFPLTAGARRQSVRGAKNVTTPATRGRGQGADANTGLRLPTFTVALSGAGRIGRGRRSGGMCHHARAGVLHADAGVVMRGLGPTVGDRGWTAAGRGSDAGGVVPQGQGGMWRGATELAALPLDVSPLLQSVEQVITVPQMLERQRRREVAEARRLNRRQLPGAMGADLARSLLAAAQAQEPAAGREEWLGVLRAASRAEAAEEALAAFEGMCAAGAWLPRDLHAANLLLNALSRDVQTAFKKYEELERQGLRGSLTTFNTLLKACMRGEDPARAELVLAALRKRGLTGDEYTFNTLIKVFSYAGDIRRVLLVQEDMREAGFVPTPSVWGSLLVACGRAGQLECAAALFRDMEAGPCAPTQDNFHALLLACVACHQGERALGLLTRMQIAGIEPDIMTYNMGIRACATPAGTTLSLDMLERAFGLMHQLKSAGVAPDVITYTSLISLCGQAGEASRALATFEEMESAGILPDEPCLTALIQACGSARPEDALEAFGRLGGGERGIRPSRAAFRAAARICREAGWLERALSVLRAARAAGFPPSNRDFREMLMACADASLKQEGTFKSQQVAEALGMLEWGEVVDLHGYHAVEGRVAVLCMLAAIQERYRQGHDVTDLIVVTGQGRHSSEEGPVLREEIRHLLNVELHLPTSHYGGKPRSFQEGPSTLPSHSRGPTGHNGSKPYASQDGSPAPPSHSHVPTTQTRSEPRASRKGRTPAPSSGGKRAPGHISTAASLTRGPRQRGGEDAGAASVQGKGTRVHGETSAGDAKAQGTGRRGRPEALMAEDARRVRRRPAGPARMKNRGRLVVTREDLLRWLENKGKKRLALPPASP